MEKVVKENKKNSDERKKKQITKLEMDSQIDMFASQPITTADCEINDIPRVASTCPPKLNMWKWVVLFDRDESARCPFEIHPISRFGSEIKDSWMKSILSTAAREKSISLSALENKTVSLFGKIEASK